MTQKELARSLGVSGAMVSRHKRAGMPVHSVVAAEGWRSTHLDPILLKCIRRPELCRAVARQEPDRVALANELGKRALGALTRESWREFVEHVEALRAVWRTMGEAEEALMQLPTKIWDAATLYQCAGSAPPAGVCVELVRRSKH